MSAEFSAYTLGIKAGRVREHYRFNHPSREAHRDNLDNYLGLSPVGYCSPKKIDWEQEIERINELEKRLVKVSGPQSARDIISSLTRVAEKHLGYGENEGSFEIGDCCRNYTIYLIEQTLEKIKESI